MEEIDETKVDVPKPVVKSTITETNKIVDISFIVDELDKYSAGDEIEWKEFPLEDLKCHISIYPKGQTSSETGQVSIFLRIETSKENLFQSDDRKISVLCQSGDTTLRYIKPVRAFNIGYGWNEILTHAEIKNHPQLHFNIKLHHDPLFVQKVPCQSFEEQQENIHEISTLHGDITLSVKIIQDEEVQNSDIDNKIKISSVILRSASKVFDRMLDTNMVEKEEKIIEVLAENIIDVKDLTYFMSTNKLRSDANPLNIIHLATYYGMDRLFWKCVNLLIKNVSIDNFANTINIFDKYEIVKGYSSLVEFAKQNEEEIKKADDFDKISHSFKCAVLSIDDD